MKQSRIREMQRGKCVAPKPPEYRVAKVIAVTSGDTRQRRRLKNDRQRRLTGGTAGRRFLQGGHAISPNQTTTPAA